MRILILIWEAFIITEKCDIWIIYAPFPTSCDVALTFCNATCYVLRPLLRSLGRHSSHLALTFHDANPYVPPH